MPEHIHSITEKHKRKFWISPEGTREVILEEVTFEGRIHEVMSQMWW